MIHLKTEEQIDGIRKACHLTADMLYNDPQFLEGRQPQPTVGFRVVRTITK